MDPINWQALLTSGNRAVMNPSGIVPNNPPVVVSPALEFPGRPRNKAPGTDGGNAC